MFLKDTNIGRLILDNVETEKTAEKKNTGKVCIEAKRISVGLTKVAGLPYNEEVYRSVQEMLKIASSCMTDLVQSFESVENRNSELEKVADIRVVVEDMASLGKIDEYNAEEKVAELMQKSDRELSIIKEATKMVLNGNDGNKFFELEKDANVSTSQKVGMFEGLLNQG